MARRSSRPMLVGPTLLAGLVVSACAVASSGTGPTSTDGTVGAAAATSIVTGTTAGSVSPPLPSCDGGDLPTRQGGMLTVATGTDARSPWVGGSGAAPGDGLETALGYAVGQALGYPKENVTWTTVDRTAAQSGRATDFDVALDQFTNGDPALADYSTGYFAITQSLLRRSDSPTVTGAAEVATAKLGVVGSPLATADEVLPAGATKLTLADALTDLTSGALDGVVVDTPAALAVTSSSSGLSVAGQLPTDPTVQPDQFQALLPKGSALTGCVSTAIDRLRVEGVLDQLSRQWIDPLAPPLR